MARKKSISDDDLLKVAREAFIQRGFAAATRDIARRAGVSEGVLFQRYRTKADLFFAAMIPPAVPLKNRTAGTEGPFEADLERLGYELLDYFRVALPVLLPLISHPDFRFEEFAQRNPETSMAVMRTEIMAFFAANGAPDPAGASLALMATMQGIALFERLGAHGGEMPRELVRRTIQTIWRGVRK